MQVFQWLATGRRFSPGTLWSMQTNVKFLIVVPSLCIIETGNYVPGKRENNYRSHTRGRNFIMDSCLFLYYVIKELYANFQEM